MSDEKVQYKLQLPVLLHTKLADQAKTEGRSLSAEIVQRLELSWNLEDPVFRGGFNEAKLHERINELKAQLGESRRSEDLLRKIAEQVGADEGNPVSGVWQKILLVDSLRTHMSGLRHRFNYTSIIDRREQLESDLRQAEHFLWSLEDEIVAILGFAPFVLSRREPYADRVEESAKLGLPKPPIDMDGDVE